MGNYIKPRGTVDIYGNLAKLYTKIEEECNDLSSKYGLNKVITPTYESSELFTRTSGETSDIVTKEMFTFLDKAERSMSLKPEGTAPVARLILENKLYAGDLPLRLFYYDTFFRYERPKAGRYREFFQYGVEIIGTESYIDDIESIRIGMELFENLGIKNVEVLINCFGNELSSSRYKTALKEKFATVVDKMCDDCKIRFEKNPLRILDCKVDVELLKELNLPKAIDFLDEDSKKYFADVLSALTELNIKYSVDNSLVRGLDYYTGAIFEFKGIDVDGLPFILGGGGRYDKLLSDIGGPKLSAVGVGIGISRVAYFLEQQNTLEFYKKSITAVIMPMDFEYSKYALKISDLLRKNNISVYIDSSARKLGSMFQSANRQNIRYAIVIGENEFNENTVSIKDLLKEQQVTIHSKLIIEYFKGRTL